MTLTERETMSSEKHFGDTTLADHLGFAIVILSVCLGIGGCMYLERLGSRESTPPVKAAAVTDKQP